MPNGEILTRALALINSDRQAASVAVAGAEKGNA